MLSGPVARPLELISGPIAPILTKVSSGNGQMSLNAQSLEHYFFGSTNGDRAAQVHGCAKHFGDLRAHSSGFVRLHLKLEA
ncbi:hypothetical protein Baya_7912 [Bagarius yarrelli]|uniref:Uncharacterized protein n=1 Tax=Bagarius yarrelli TaxID=175774 RepID=A0A556U2N8_BAGYA|nr:hypothetical protein Baya_7912 [Bagarius yarrelli]